MYMRVCMYDCFCTKHTYLYKIPLFVWSDVVQKNFSFCTKNFEKFRKSLCLYGQMWYRNKLLFLYQNRHSCAKSAQLALNGPKCRSQTGPAIGIALRF